MQVISTWRQVDARKEKKQYEIEEASSMQQKHYPG
jgi:hypothetical protein